LKKKEVLAFVDHPFHKKTRSADFLRNIFKKRFRIINIWGQNLNYKKLKKYKNIFFFQSFLSFKNLISLQDKKIIWAPMYDSLSNFDKNIFQICALFPNIKILSFSDEIRKYCIKYNVKYENFTYMIKPTYDNKKNKNFNIFFWYRGSTKIFDWIKAINFLNYDNIYYFKLVDPKYTNENLSKNFLKKHKIKIFQGHKTFSQSKKKYISLLKKSSIFVAPRIKEGIGMSNIEAMSNSKYIIGFNENTLNQYLKKKEMGLLLNTKRKVKVSKKYIIKTEYKRYQNYLKIYKKWLKDEKKIKNLYDHSVRNSLNKNLKFYRLFYENIFFNMKSLIIKKIILIRDF
tara:strand:+ start:4313 stop:5341 length:1029 start_codon:yes stop_codon:yes gene_type:complete